MWALNLGLRENAIARGVFGAFEGNTAEPAAASGIGAGSTSASNGAADVGLLFGARGFGIGDATGDSL